MDLNKKDVVSIRFDVLDNLGSVDKRITIPLFNMGRSDALALRLELNQACHIGYIAIHLENNKVI